MSITITDVGPAESLSIPIRPGVTVLRGVNDSGKSLAIDAVSRLAGGSAPISCRDKAAVGYVEGLGVKISVRQSARRSGELEALSIEGRLSISDLVDPKMKDPAAADRHRIKALLQLTGVGADIDLFATLFQDNAELREHVSAETLKAGDLVEMAARLKRDLEAASRKALDNARKAEARALGCREAVEGVDLDADCDSSTLQAELETAIQQDATLANRATESHRVRQAAQEAQERLDAMKAEQAGPSVEQAADAMEATAAWNRVQELREALAEAERVFKTSEGAVKEARRAFDAAKRQEQLVAGWQATIQAGADVEAVSVERLVEAQDAVERARRAVEQGAVIRHARQKAAEAEGHADEAKAHGRVADSLREAARGTDDVLSQAVASDSLTVKHGRLVTQHPDRGEVFYSERSDGTRWKLAIDEAIKRIRQLGADQTAIIPVPQAAWSELDPANKAAIHAYAASLGVCIVTAEATNGELRAERFEQ